MLNMHVQDGRPLWQPRFLRLADLKKWSSVCSFFEVVHYHWLVLQYAQFEDIHSREMPQPEAVRAGQPYPAGFLKIQTLAQADIAKSFVDGFL